MQEAVFLTSHRLWGGPQPRGLGETDLAESLDEAALALQDRFSRSFWSDELGTFVLASASVFSLLQACLGLTISRADNRIAFFWPVLPPFLERVSITNIRVGDSTLDIEFHRHAEDVGIQVVRRDGDAQVLVVK